MKTEDFNMQSRLDAYTGQYQTSNYETPIETLKSIFRGRKIKFLEKREHGRYRIYKIRETFDIKNAGDVFSQNLGMKEFLQFDTLNMKFKKLFE